MNIVLLHLLHLVLRHSFANSFKLFHRFFWYKQSTVHHLIPGTSQRQRVRLAPDHWQRRPVERAAGKEQYLPGATFNSNAELGSRRCCLSGA